VMIHLLFGIDAVQERSGCLACGFWRFFVTLPYLALRNFLRQGAVRCAESSLVQRRRGPLKQNLSS
jgi:hypothetical protein